MIKVKHNLTEICKQFKPLMRDYIKSKASSAYMETINKVSVYVNDEGTYFSLTVAGEEYNIHSRSNEATCDSGKYNDKVELIIMDALVTSLNDIEKAVKKIRTNYDNDILSMINGIVKRRKIETPKEFLEDIALPEKVYI